MIRPVLASLAFLFASISALAQSETSSWQQHVDYTMDVKMDVESFQYSGTQKIVYTNNSPDELRRVYFHLYFNAFQPGSEMDMRLQNVRDPDRRMMNGGKSRIAVLKPEEQGYLHITSLTQDGTAVKYLEEETILVVDLAEPIASGSSTTFDLSFMGQVPLQIRRSGRNNAEGIALSMSQWYPKLAEYDFEGWHPNPYIAREFHGVWGNFDVKITLDKDYVIGATGYLQNPGEIGHGYGEKTRRTRGKTLTWHFKAPRVMDFVWGADPGYTHDTLKVKGGPVLHFFYKGNDQLKENWKNLQPKAAAAMTYLSEHIGPYPYEQYSIIQGGDGGMEYPMATLITGDRSFGSLVGVTVHEMAHSWFQHLLGTNESKYEWMDEGFTSYISALCMNEIMERDNPFPFSGSYSGYRRLANSGVEEPQTTHADRYNTNFAYGSSAYSKGAVFLAQLGYVIGEDKRDQAIKQYYEQFKFRHPIPNDIKRVAEKVSGIELEWYLNDWTRTTNTIDYAISEVEASGEKTRITLKRKGQMPMPIDLFIKDKEGNYHNYYIPLRMMRGEKDNPYPAYERKVLRDWAWTHPSYTFEVDLPYGRVDALAIDPSGLMADVELSDNEYTVSE